MRHAYPGLGLVLLLQLVIPLAGANVIDARSYDNAGCPQHVGYDLGTRT